MGRNTSVSLGDYFECFVVNKICEGRFKNASEVIRAGLRLLEKEENKLLLPRKAINIGIEGGVAKDFDPVRQLKFLNTKKKNDS
ncbi:MAG: type II toxin-antitoxin system ParD family antitoxin [Ginsengibacter sp.]